ncbi:hypothetical protein, partial [Vibrio parahaemolyticus]|uniref:hypothetical protein n=3 Tax=Vibrio parahaemolyticus TaxID=670 RepID=UPI001C5F404F
LVATTQKICQLTSKKISVCTVNLNTVKKNASLAAGIFVFAVSKGPDSNAWVRGPSEAQTKTGFQLEPRFIQK